jgi:Kef-type K+ transport system membrane component KefB
MKEQIFILFLVIGGAALVPFFARRVRVPSAALEIVYGIFLFNMVIPDQPEWFSLFKELGLIYLMFLVGMELDIRKVVQGKRLFWYVLLPLLSLALMPLVFVRLGYSFYLGIVVAIFSAGIIIPVLKESALIKTDVGRDILGTALVGELLSILVLMGIDIGHRYGFTSRAAVEGGKFLILSAAAALFLRFLYIIAWWNPKKVERVMESEDPVEEGIRMVIFIAFTGALLASISGLEPILGSFMAGLVFGYVFKSKGRFEDKINAVGFGFFTPFFFIGVGADLDIDLLRSPQTLRIAFFLTVMVLVSNLVSLVFSRLMRLKVRDAFGMALLLSSPLSLMVVAATLGTKMGLLNTETGGACIITAVFSSILYPSLFRPIGRTILIEKSGEKNPPVHQELAKKRGTAVK